MSRNTHRWGGRVDWDADKRGGVLLVLLVEIADCHLKVKLDAALCIG